MTALPRILLVDSSRTVRTGLAKHLDGRFDVREESDGEAAWQTLVLDNTIQVVISDLQLPKLNGFELLERLLENWWNGIGETDYAGIPKLMVAEARNFPEVAQFYYENVIRRARALIGSALERGMSSGEFRRMDVETTIEVLVAPILMLLIWRYSMSCCQCNPVDPRSYLSVHLDLLRQGLQCTQV